jgi:hypothetical protein
MRGCGRGLAGLSLCLAAVSAGAQELPPMFGRYMPLYPWLYLTAGYGQNERDGSYDRNGTERNSAAPQAGGQTAFPVTDGVVAFTWHFPMFESSQVPFLSSRTHLARITLRYRNTRTEGQLASFVADTSDDASTDADDLRNHGSGLGDPEFEFGSYLIGSPADSWRTRTTVPYAVLLLVGARMPGGVYDRDAPVSAGSNTWSAHAQLAAHWRPWRGGFVDGSFGIREFFQNYDAAFGALHPTNQGDERYWDISLGQRLFRSFYLTAFASGREGDPNRYGSPRFAPNKPPPPSTTPPSDNFPTPGDYFDDGTELLEIGGSVSYFIGQRWLLGLHYSLPQSGNSGQFLLPYSNRQPAQCTPGGVGCSVTAGETVLVDGMGPARSYSSAHWMVTLSHNFGQGDSYTCVGCRESR